MERRHSQNREKQNRQENLSGYRTVPASLPLASKRQDPRKITSSGDLRLKKRILKILKEKSLVFEKVRLSSGKESDYYIDAKLTTLDPEGSHLVASIFLDKRRAK